MSIHASPERSAPALAVLQHRAGAVGAEGPAGRVVLNYGSAAGELAACVTGTGLAECSWLSQLELSGPDDVVTDAVYRLTGSSVACGGVLHAVSAWWCSVRGGQVIVLCERAIADRLRGLLEVLPGLDPRLQIADRSSEWAVLAVVGRRTAQVLAALGVYGKAGDPRSVAPFAAAPTGSVPTLWLLASDHRVLALVPRARAGEAWLAIDHAGRGAGICCVGREALARYALLDRRTPLAPV